MQPLSGYRQPSNPQAKRHLGGVQHNVYGTHNQALRLIPYRIYLLMVRRDQYPEWSFWNKGVGCQRMQQRLRSEKAEPASLPASTNSGFACLRRNQKPTESQIRQALRAPDFVFGPTGQKRSISWSANAFPSPNFSK